MQDVDAFAFGRFRMDVTRRVLLVDGLPVALHARAFDILEFLVASRGRVVTRGEIVGHVWRGVVVGENNLSVQLSTLRRVLAAHGGAELIVTVPHRGYQFIDGSTTAEVAGIVRPAGASLPHRRRAAAAVLMLGLGILVAVWRLEFHAPTKRGQAEAFSPPPHSIAVLAFENMSGDPAQEYFSDGISEELIDTLSRIRQLQVVGRTSSFSFKGRSVALGEIARALNVRAVLEGSVRRQGTRVRITADLSDATTGYQLWSESFDREQTALLDVQREIASSIGHALQLKVVGDEELTKGGTADAQAFDHYLLGVQRLRSGGTSQELQAAAADFHAALSLDPGFALAECGLANALTSLGQLAVGMPPADIKAVFASGLKAADHALALQPDLGSAHAARGLALSHGLGDNSGAMVELQRAETLEPGNATIEIIYSDVAMSLGRVDEALASVRRAMALDPLRADAWWDAGFEFYSARHYDDALKALQRGKTLAGTLPPPFVMTLGFVYLELGRPQEAQQVCAASGDQAECLAIAYHALRRQSQADAELSKLHASLGDAGAYNYAEVAAQWGSAAESLNWLRKAAALKDPGLPAMGSDPLLDPLRGKAEFRDFEMALR